MALSPDNVATLADGRALGYAECGDPTGTPVLGFHGTPSSRLDEEVQRREKSRLGYLCLLPSAPRLSQPPLRKRILASKFAQPALNRGERHPGRTDHGARSAAPKRFGLGRNHQPTRAFVEMWRKGVEPRANTVVGIFHPLRISRRVNTCQVLFVDDS